MTFYDNLLEKTFQQSFNSTLTDSDLQEILVTKIVKAIEIWWYTSVLIFCWNYLLWVNEKWICIPCIPELFEDWDSDDKENLLFCENMNEMHYNTKFSFFSLKMWLKIYDRLAIWKQILLSVDDKYVDENDRRSCLNAWFDSIPMIYQELFQNIFPRKIDIQEHLSIINSLICDSNVWKINDFLLSEKYLVRRYKARRENKNNYHEYNRFYKSLGDDFSSCSLEIFHLLVRINEIKAKIFKNSDKVCVLLFVPDACVSSAVSWWMAVTKITKDFEIINVTQIDWIINWQITLTNVTQEWIKRL